MTNQLWEFFKPVLMARGFSYYIDKFDSINDLIEIVPVIIELNKMGISIKTEVDDPLKLLLAGSLRYRGYDIKDIESILDSGIEDSMNNLREEGYSDRDIVNLLKNFEKVLNCFDYSSIEGIDSVVKSRNELLSCFFYQLFGSKPTFDVTSLSYDNLLKVFRLKESPEVKNINIPETVMIVNELDELEGYLMQTSSKPVGISHESLLNYGYILLGCKKKVRGALKDNYFKVGANVFVRMNVFDIINKFKDKGLDSSYVIAKIK